MAPNASLVFAPWGAFQEEADVVVDAFVLDAGNITELNAKWIPGHRQMQPAQGRLR
jgi:hypothetical protein